LQIALEQAYLVAQGFGWNWGENRKPRDDPGFCLVYTCALAISAIPIAAGVDPLKLTVFSMALTAVSLPLTVVPFLVLMNDERYVGRHGNGVISNTVVVAIIVLAFVLAIVALPLQVLGGA
jgi:Mn2+/Fe2+ NRAMP family transporter